MDSTEGLYCGKDIRKYVYIISAVAVVILIGSYWYVEYYLKGVGVAQQGVPMAYTQGAMNGGFNGQFAPANPALGSPMAMPAAFVTSQQVTEGPFTWIVRALKPSVVNVSSTQGSAIAGARSLLATPPLANTPPGEAKFARPTGERMMESIGSGIILTDDGYILTNYHVLEMSQSVLVTVFTPQGARQYPGEILRMDESTDLALLKIQPDVPLTPAPLSNNPMPQVGDAVIAIGSPFGLDQTVSQGIVSGFRKAIVIEGVAHRNLIQTDAAINQGNSGGPLADMSGNVVGVNTAIYTPTGAFAGISFAVPVETVRKFLQQTLQMPGDFFGGVPENLNVATNRTPGVPPPIPINSRAPHENRGVCESCHQIIPAPQGVNGQVVYNNGVPSMASGATAINAGGGYVGGYPPSSDWLGALLVPLDAQMVSSLSLPNSEGVYVRDVAPGLVAQSAGLQPGDVVIKVNGRWVKTPADMLDRLLEKRGGTARISLVRQGKRQELSLPVVMSTVGNTPIQPVAMVRPAMSMNGPPMMNGSPGYGPPMMNGSPVMNGPPTIGAPLNGMPMQAVPLPAAPPPAKAAGALKTEFEWMGMELAPISPAKRNKAGPLKDKWGALVGEVDPGLAAANAGIKANDIILRINGQSVDGAGPLDQAIQGVKGQTGVVLEIERAGQRMYATLQ